MNKTAVTVPVAWTDLLIDCAATIVKSERNQRAGSAEIIMEVIQAASSGPPKKPTPNDLIRMKAALTTALVRLALTDDRPKSDLLELVGEAYDGMRHGPVDDILKPN